VTTDEVIAAIERERARLLAALDAIGSDAAAIPVTEEGWTAKDVLAHLIHWATAVAYGLGENVDEPAYMAAERMRRKAAGLPDAMPSGAESNALVVAHFADIPLEDVRAQFEQLADVILERARTKSDDEMNATGAIAWSPDRVLWQFIGGDTFLHWPVHSDMIERATPR
jgi:hypothetical protein